MTEVQSLVSNVFKCDPHCMQGLLLYVAKAAGNPPGPPAGLGSLNVYELDTDTLLQVCSCSATCFTVRPAKQVSNLKTCDGPTLKTGSKGGPCKARNLF